MVVWRKREKDDDGDGHSLPFESVSASLLLLLYDDDIVPWVSWFVDKVGVQLANELLFDPLLEAYRLYGNATKLAMQQQ